MYDETTINFFVKSFERLASIMLEIVPTLVEKHFFYFFLQILHTAFISKL